jgi:predicted DNA-binding transcriptional regulator
VLPRAKVYRHLAPKGTGMKIREILWSLKSVIQNQVLVRNIVAMIKVLISVYFL